MANYSRHQQNIIRNYYQNREAISLQRLQELVTELYLAEGKRRARQWRLIRTHLEKLGVRPAVLDHLERQDKPELVANLVQKLLAKS